MIPSGGVQDAKGTHRLALTLNHQEIAEALGSSRETVTKTLGEFKKANLIAVQGAKISIRNQAAMEKLLGS